MSDSEGEEQKATFVPFSAREGWSDITPIKQDDGPNPVCQIAYSPEFSEVMDYFRAILQKDERSERALQLSSEVIECNPANYTAWYFRRLVLDALKSDLKKELEFVSKVGFNNPKNYQIWHHRKLCVEKLGDYSTELEYIGKHIKKDSKNYHAWSYRQWVIEAHNLWDTELAYLDALFKEDMRNNSVWNQRYFIISRNKKKPISKDCRDTEINFAIDFIRKAPNNECPWTYLRGLFLQDKYATNPILKQTLLDLKQKYTTSPHVVSLLLDIYEQEGTKESIEAAVELCNILETSLDTLHRKYWVFRKERIFGSLGGFTV